MWFIKKHSNDNNVCTIQHTHLHILTGVGALLDAYVTYSSIKSVYLFLFKTQFSSITRVIHKLCK